MRARNSSGVEPTGSINCAASFSRIAGSLMIADHVLVDLVDHRLRRAARRDQAHPGVGVDVDAALLQRRHVGQDRASAWRSTPRGSSPCRSRPAASPRSPAGRPSARRRGSPPVIACGERGVGDVHHLGAGSRARSPPSRGATASRCRSIRNCICPGCRFSRADQLGDAVDPERRN